MDDQFCIKKALYWGKIDVNGNLVNCAVLEDGSRILSERGVSGALGIGRSGSHYKRKKEKAHGAHLPVYASANNLEPFIDGDLMVALSNPIQYTLGDGKRVFKGVEAILLTKVCDVWLSAREAGALQQQQLHIAQAAEVLTRSFAKIGIVALIDEATGFQDKRDKDELQRFLALYLSEERLGWAKMFPDEYYKQLFRLMGWTYNPLTPKRPQLIGKLTNDIVYERLAPNVLEELRILNPVQNRQTGRRQATHHQHLSRSIGQPDLRDHLLQVIAIMRASSNKTTFFRNLDKALPKAGGVQMDFDEFMDE